MIESGDRKTSDEITEFLADSLDIALGVLGYIPLVGAVLDGARLAGSIPDRLFRAKSRRFFEEMDRASKNEIDAFIRQLEQEEKLTDFGRNVLFLIDKMDDLEKPIIVGRLFRAAVERKLSLDAAKRIASLVNAVYSPDLKSLWEFRQDAVGKDPDISATLATAGFLRAVSEDWGNVADGASGTTVTYTLNQYGRTLLEFGMSP
ncbi:hypothetical protein G6M02_00015 [Agrobacterium rhizogenes]|nr:hypothetical protein [Rhizobium rhizogenes]